jgi:hypothetical protein
MNTPSQETISNLYALAASQIQSDINADKMWMHYNPYIITIASAVAVLCLLIILVNEIINHVFRSYDRDTRFGFNLGSVIVGIVALSAGAGFTIGFLSASSDYNFKTTSPDVATYQMVVSYLARGV